MLYGIERQNTNHILAAPWGILWIFQRKLTLFHGTIIKLVYALLSYDLIWPVTAYNTATIMVTQKLECEL